MRLSNTQILFSKTANETFENTYFKSFSQKRCDSHDSWYCFKRRKIFVYYWEFFLGLFGDLFAVVAMDEIGFSARLEDLRVLCLRDLVVFKFLASSCGNVSFALWSNVILNGINELSMLVFLFINVVLFQLYDEFLLHFFKA